MARYLVVVVFEGVSKSSWGSLVGLCGYTAIENPNAGLVGEVLHTTPLPLPCSACGNEPLLILTPKRQDRVKPSPKPREECNHQRVQHTACDNRTIHGCLIALGSAQEGKKQKQKKTECVQATARDERALHVIVSPLFYSFTRCGNVLPASSAGDPGEGRA